jgi:hypothetical protein
MSIESPASAGLFHLPLGSTISAEAATAFALHTMLVSRSTESNRMSHRHVCVTNAIWFDELHTGSPKEV